LWYRLASLPPIAMKGREPKMRVNGAESGAIVVGCGPVGAVMALALSVREIPVMLLEAEPAPVEDHRAATIHPPTVEMLFELGLKDEAFSEASSGGLLAPLFHFRDRVTGDLVGAFDVRMLDGEVRCPFVLQWEQHKLVQAALRKLQASPLAEIRFSARVVGLEQDSDHVDVTIQNAMGEAEHLRAKYLIGADGGRSAVRQLAGIAFEGFTWPERFIKIATTFDFEVSGRGYCTRNYFSDPDEWLNLFKVKGDGTGLWRGVFPVPTHEPDESAISLEGVQRRLHQVYRKSGDYEIAHHQLYTVHQRVASTFNKGRVLLAGDSAHVNNPIGGLGMNSGIHDAMNLAEKLNDIFNGHADPTVLDRYSRQRRKAQTDFVQAQSIANKQTLEERDPLVRRRHLDGLRHTSEDVTLHKQFLYRSLMFDSLRAANAVV
jgi:3-(3-hydroxy-phenyl)propionate hydroxylase